MIWVLIAAAIISGLLGEWIDSTIILIVVIINAFMGTIQESKAEAALASLNALAAPFAAAFRNGHAERIPSADLVVGDIVILEAGDSIPADLRLLECKSLKIEESALTGESVPVDKSTDVLTDPSAGIGDRLNMAYMGTSATYGRGTGVVTATGMNTEVGKIADQLNKETDSTTPLQKKLNQISTSLSFGIIGIAIVIFVIGMLLVNMRQAALWPEQEP